MIALYLRGAPRSAVVSRRSWPLVVAALRKHPCANAYDCLYESGLWTEANLMLDQSLIDWARRQIDKDACVSIESPTYPARWRDSLGHSAPPAVWRSSSEQSSSGCSTVLGIVGVRDPSPGTARFTRQITSEAVLQGYTIVSGGAKGCDRTAELAAEKAGGSVLRVLPFGLAYPHTAYGTTYSVCAPNEPFSTAAAMERNTLIYAMGVQTIVAGSHFKSGGTWAGATEALRRKLNSVIARDDGSLAQRSLIALGAIPIGQANEFQTVVEKAHQNADCLCFG